jgi:hypothetical protein
MFSCSTSGNAVWKRLDRCEKARQWGSARDIKSPHGLNYSFRAQKLEWD